MIRRKIEPPLRLLALLRALKPNTRLITEYAAPAHITEDTDITSKLVKFLFRWWIFTIFLKKYWYLPRTVLSPICAASITASPEVTTVPRKTLSSVKGSEESGSADRQEEVFSIFTFTIKDSLVDFNSPSKMIPSTGILSPDWRRIWSPFYNIINENLFKFTITINFSISFRSLFLKSVELCSFRYCETAENPVDIKMAKISEIASYQLASPIAGKNHSNKVEDDFLILRAAKRIRIHWSWKASIRIEKGAR